MKTEMDVLREHLERYRAVTLQFLDVVPTDRLHWRPDDDSFTVGEHLQHIAQTEDYYGGGLFRDAWDVSLIRLTEDAHSGNRLRAYFADVRRRTMEALERLTDGDLAQLTDVPHAPDRFPLRWWLWFILEHEIHHKAQLGVYLKQMGLVAPFYAMPLPVGARPDIAARRAIQEGRAP
jgi:uncharacterized damage-inducible protein DinB